MGTNGVNGHWEGGSIDGGSMRGPRPPILDLCVVVLNYNGGALLGSAVEAAARQTGLSCAVVVVDNASTDGSFDLLAARVAATELGRDGAQGGGTPDVRGGRYLLLRVGQNRGYAAGNNLGLFGFPARYIVLLNPDAIVNPETLPTMLRFMDAHPEVGACGPRLSWPDGTAQPFSHGGDPTPTYLGRRFRARLAGGQLHDWGGTAGGGVAEGQVRSAGAPVTKDEPAGEGEAPRPVDWVAGTCLMIRATALGEVGLLDERIFMYFEDNDLCLRLRNRGWAVYFLPEVEVRHHNRPSYADRRRVRSYYRGLARFYATHYCRAAGLAVRAAGEVAALLRRAQPEATNHVGIHRPRVPVPIELTPQALYIDAHPGIVWEILRSVGKGKLPGSRNRARLIEDHGDTLLVEFTSVDGAKERITVEEVTFYPPDRVTYAHLGGPLRSAFEEFLVQPTENGGTTLRYSGHFKAKLPLIGPLYVKPIFDRLVLEHIEELKRAAETRAARSRKYPRPVPRPDGFASA